MKIWRIDATFAGDEVERNGAIVEDVVGMLTMFAGSEADRDELVRRLVDTGWDHDAYGEKVGEPPAEILGRLFRAVWPVLPTAILLDLAANEPPVSREQLDGMLTAHGLPRLKLAEMTGEAVDESPQVVPAPDFEKELTYEPISDSDA